MTTARVVGKQKRSISSPPIHMLGCRVRCDGRVLLPDLVVRSTVPDLAGVSDDPLFAVSYFTQHPLQTR